MNSALFGVNNAMLVAGGANVVILSITLVVNPFLCKLRTHPTLRRITHNT